MAKSALMLRAAMLLVLAVSAMGCAQTSTITAPPPEPPRIPVLPPQARQQELPSICLPSCSAGLTKLRESWRKRLTSPTPQDAPVSALQTR